MAPGLPALVAAALALCMGLGTTASATLQMQQESVPGHVIVRFEPGVGGPARQAVLARVEGRVLRPLPVAHTALVHAPGTAPAAARELERDPRVRWAEPDYIYDRRLFANDTGFAQQWGLSNAGQVVNGRAGVPGADIDAPPAWDITTGSPAVKLAIIDGGVDATHPDLAPNFAAPANPGETGAGRETNKIDDDGNGFIDDFRGWDWAGADNDPSDDDPVGHGTHVAGVAAARGNEGAGTAGVSWQARLIALRALDASGAGTSASIAAAIAYAGERGARIANGSFGGPASSQAVSDAIADAPNMLFVTAAGNGGDDGVGDNVDGPEVDFPCDLTLPNVVCVAATDQADELTSFSNFGAVSVDLAAPGENIFAPRPGSGFQHLDGTSFAAPFVAGTASLVLAAHPAASTAQLRGALLGGVDPLPGLAGRVTTGGRLNARGALSSVPPAVPGPPVQTGPAADVAETTARLTGTVTPRGQRTSAYFEYGITTAYGSETPTRRAGAGTAAVPLAEGVSDLAPGTRYQFRTVAADATGISYGPNASFTTPAPAIEKASPIGPRDLTIVRRGRTWYASLRLTSFTVATGLLERASKARGSTVRFRSVNGIRRRGYEPGVRRIVLGRLRPATYRLTLNVNSAAGPQRLRRGFHVAGSPIRRVRITTRGGVTVATVRLAARARLRGGLERRKGSRFAFLRPFVTRVLSPGTRRVWLGRGLAPGLYRLRLEALGSAGKATTVTFRLS